jgi:hypothetical protein
MNKTKMKINRRKSKTRKNTTTKIKGGGIFNSFKSIFSSSKVSNNFKELLKNKNISDDVQKVYDAKNKDETTFNTALNGLKEKLKGLNLLIPNIESEKKTEYNNISIKNPLRNSTNTRPMNRGTGTANAVAAGAGAVAGIAGAGAALVGAKNDIFGSK